MLHNSAKKEEDFNANSRGLSDFLMKKDDIDNLSRQGSGEFFYGIKLGGASPMPNVN